MRTHVLWPLNMSLRALATLLITILIAGIIALGASHIARTHTGEKKFRGNPILYAETSTTSPPLSTLIGTNEKRVNLPILVYHVVRPSYPSDSVSVRAIAMTPEIFDAEMSHLKNAGYHVVRFSDLEAYFSSNTPLPFRPVILSFDDGWSDQFIYAFPILQKYQYPATFFVFTNAIGHKGFLTWDNLHALVAAGMTIGDHTRSHPYLTSITSTTTLRSEIEGSQKILKERLGVPVNEFAYPFGQYNPTIVSIVREAGYSAARGDYYTGEQSADRLFELSATNAPTTTARFEQLFPR